MPNPDWEDGYGPLDARTVTLREVIEDTGANTFKYLHDFGDGWEHAVRIGRIDAADPEASYPRLLKALGRCPPEDAGGIPQALLELALTWQPGSRSEKHRAAR